SSIKNTSPPLATLRSGGLPGRDAGGVLARSGLGGVSRGDRAKAEGAARAGERSQETAGAQNKTQAPVTQAPPPLPAAVQPVAQVTTVPAAPPLVSRPSRLSDFQLGGYGSTRLEANDPNQFSDPFTDLNRPDDEEH